MPKKTVTITIVAGALQVSSASVKAKPKTNDTLCFKCPDGEFSVLYKNARSPYKTGEKAVSGNRGTTPTAALKIRKLTTVEQGNTIGDPISGATFEYGVVVLDPTTGNILTLDPDIIIDDPSGGGGGNSKPAKAKKKKK